MMIRGLTADKRLVLTRTQAAGVLLFLYLVMPFATMLLQIALRPLGVSYMARPVVSIVVYGLTLIFCVIEKRFRPVDFLVLLLLIVLFFLTTSLFHPEYDYWYQRPDYGVWNYVLRPDNGLYIYLFIRLVNDPEEILKVLRISAWTMYVYYGYQLLKALRQGYWNQQNAAGEAVQMSYNLSYGYAVLLFALVMLLSALERKQLIDWVGAVAGFLMVFLGGSRGPILDIGVFVALYLLIRMERSKKRGVMVLSTLIVAPALYFTYDYILGLIAAVLSRLHISNRFLVMLINGDIANDSGRDKIWAAAINMIKERPLGYGAMGSRHVLSNYHIVGHPHQFFLEILIDFGVFFGSLIIVFLLYHSVKLLIARDGGKWQMVFLVFFARACQLLTSLTFWHSIGLWGALAVGVCAYEARRKRKAIQ